MRIETPLKVILSICHRHLHWIIDTSTYLWVLIVAIRSILLIVQWLILGKYVSSVFAKFVLLLRGIQSSVHHDPGRVHWFLRVHIVCFCLWLALSVV